MVVDLKINADDAQYTLKEKTTKNRMLVMLSIHLHFIWKLYADRRVSKPIQTDYQLKIQGVEHRI